MRFSHTQLDTALVNWRQARDLPSRAKADNIWFEERVSPVRAQHFEATAGDIPSATALENCHTDYCRKHVQTSGSEVPATFREGLEPVRLGGMLDTAQRIVRLERIPRRVLTVTGYTVDDLLRALRTRDYAVLDVVLQQWNAVRDNRPAFGAWKDEVVDDLHASDWADRLRDNLGLAHYDPVPGSTIPVMLMEYDVATVLRSAAANGIRGAFTVPTVLDSEPWQWFFPAPGGLSYGRVLNLGPGPDARLFVEFLHVGIPYTRDHISRMGEIVRPVESIDIRMLRNRHLAALRQFAQQPDFGEEMP